MTINKAHVHRHFVQTLFTVLHLNGDILSSFNQSLPEIPPESFFFDLADMCVGQRGVMVFRQIFLTLMSIIKDKTAIIDELLSKNKHLEQKLEDMLALQGGTRPIILHQKDIIFVSFSV